MSEIEPSQKGDNGRANNGQFAPGWRGGPGNPLSQKVNRLRAVLLQTVTPQDLEEVIKLLVEKAKQGDTIAIKELLDRCLGKAGVLSNETEADGHTMFTLHIGNVARPPTPALPNRSDETQNGD